MSTPLELAHKLIALALNNPYEEEAKLAALKAVKLIKQHNLLPGAPSERRRPDPTPPTRPTRPMWDSPPPQYRWEDDPIYNWMHRTAQERTRQDKAKEDQARARTATDAANESARKRGGTYYKPNPSPFSGVEPDDFEPEYFYRDFDTKRDMAGHDFSLSNNCKTCKIPRSLFDSSGITCHGYSEAKRGAEAAGPNVPFDVLQELDRMQKQDPKMAAKMKDFLDSLYRNSGGPKHKW